MAALTRPINIALFIFLLLPLWVVIGGRLLGLDSVGPMVPITWALNTIVLPVLLYKAVPGHMLVKVVFAAVGIVLAYVHFISYIHLAPAFGVSNYQWI